MDDKYVLAIDVGTSSIKVLVGKMEIEGNITVAGSGTTAAKGIERGIISDLPLLVQSIEQAVECAVMATNFSVTDAFIGVGGIKLRAADSVGSVTPLNPGGITLDDVERVYRAAALVAVPDDHKVLHILPKRIFVDKERRNELPIQEKGSHLEVEAHVVSIPKVLYEDLAKAVEGVGINVIGMAANAVAVAEALVPAPVDTMLVIDVGAGITEMVLYHNKQIDGMTALPLGGDYITNDIMQGLVVSWEHAEEIKKYYAKLSKDLLRQKTVLDCNAYGTNDKNVSYDFLYEIVESRIRELVYLIYEHSKVFLAERKIEKVLLAGGCGAMPSFVERIETTFDVPAEIINLQELPFEYKSPRNIACYGILKYAGKNLPRTQVGIERNLWRLLIGKCKNFFCN